MARSLAAASLCVALLMPSPGAAQMTLDEAREAGKALGNATRQDESLVPTGEARAHAVPGYSGTDLPQGSYFDEPERLEAAGASARATSEPYRITTNAEGTRANFSSKEILDVTRRATEIEGDPSHFLAGEDLAASSGSCVPLPPGAGTQGYYEATCNRGTRLEEAIKSCRVTMTPEVGTVTTYRYYAVPDSAYGTPFARHAAIAPHIASGVCKPTGVSKVACAAHVDYGWTPATNKYCDDYSATEYECTASLAIAVADSPVTLASWHARSSTNTVTTRKVDGCGGLAGDAMCGQRGGDVCTEGAETRIIDGVPVTEACWAWTRDYTCRVESQATDCGELEANGLCSYLRTDCLDEGYSGGACKVEERVYRCPTPDAPAKDSAQYICGDDVFCINGDCEPIVREASSEFRDALVALHSIDQAGREFDETNFTVFKGSRDTCHKPVFGLINCCAGKVSGALSVGAGAAALAGGPAAIAALATPFLTMFACSSGEKQLDIKDRMGFCHKVGTYCSASVLGVCTSKRTTYCCFESKLSRILQEQGRPQLGKPWGAPKYEQCLGFTVEEFSRLDLSVMDFTEVYTDFMDAAKLPDEIETLTEIQRKIEGYYDLHGK